MLLKTFSTNKQLNALLILFNLIGVQIAFSQERTVEAEIDTAYHFKFQPQKELHRKSILIDASHNTIYSKTSGKLTAREMLSIMEKDGYKINFTKSRLNYDFLKNSKSDLLILHGMPNDRIILNSGKKKEILYKSPLGDDEVIGIAKYVYDGGSLFLFLSHFPNGSGALPLLESFSVKFRDGSAFHHNDPGRNCGKCSHFVMTQKNRMINYSHPVFKTSLSKTLLPETVKFLCGAAIFRNPEDNILPFPNNTINFTPTTDGSLDIEERSDSYSGMIGFEFGAGRVIICTDQGIFRSLDIFIDGDKIPVTIHDPESENAKLLLNSIRWLTKAQ
mgnify:CR=1 FL=1